MRAWAWPRGGWLIGGRGGGGEGLGLAEVQTTALTYLAQAGVEGWPNLNKQTNKALSRRSSEARTPHQRTEELLAALVAVRDGLGGEVAHDDEEQRGAVGADALVAAEERLCGVVVMGVGVGVGGDGRRQDETGRGQGRHVEARQKEGQMNNKQGRSSHHNKNKNHNPPRLDDSTTRRTRSFSRMLGRSRCRSASTTTIVCCPACRQQGVVAESNRGVSCQWWDASSGIVSVSQSLSVCLQQEGANTSTSMPDAHTNTHTHPSLHTCFSMMARSSYCCGVNPFPSSSSDRRCRSVSALLVKTTQGRTCKDGTEKSAA